MFKKFEQWLIKKYQAFSQSKPAKCRLMPTCSTYALISLNRFGLIKGNFLILKRILKCGFLKTDNIIDRVPNNIKGDFKWLI